MLEHSDSDEKKSIRFDSRWRIDFSIRFDSIQLDNLIKWTLVEESWFFVNSSFFCFLTSNHRLFQCRLYRASRLFSVAAAPCGLRGCNVIDPLRFLTGWRKRRLNQALSVPSLSLGFLSVLYCCLVWPLFVLHWFVFCTSSVSWLLWFRCQYQCKWLTAKTCLRNDL